MKIIISNSIFIVRMVSNAQAVKLNISFEKSQYNIRVFVTHEEAEAMQNLIDKEFEKIEDE